MTLKSIKSRSSSVAVIGAGLAGSQAALAVDRVKKYDFENERFLEACLSIEVLAQRGYGALPFGAFMPVGFTDPKTGKRPFAVCQLRKENA